MTIFKFLLPLSMESITIHPQTKDQIETVKAFLKALKIPFQQSMESPYNPDFVKKIKESEASVKAGDTYKISLDEIWK